MDIIKIEIVNDNQIKYIYEDGTYSIETYSTNTYKKSSQLDRIEANTQSLISSNSALNVLLGVSE